MGCGARVRAVDVSINGNVQAEGAVHVALGGFSTVGGSVQIVQGGGATIVCNRTQGDLQFESNVVALKCHRQQHRWQPAGLPEPGGLTLVNNRMHGNLQCKESVPAPVGGGNRSPSKEDQCARL